MDKSLRKKLFWTKSRAFVIGFGCTVPAVTANRTLPSERDRKIRILLMLFMSCSAKLPIYSFFVSDLRTYEGRIVFSGNSDRNTCLHLIYRKTLFHGDAVPFVMELPTIECGNAQCSAVTMGKSKRFYTESIYCYLIRNDLYMVFAKF